jgi:hypothetical protein
MELETNEMCSNRISESKTILPIGMLSLVIAIAWPNFFHPAGGLAQSLSDGGRGLMFGLSIGINLFAAFQAGRRRPSGNRTAGQ